MIEWHNNDGIITCLIDGEIPQPFRYIVAKAPPPYIVEPIDGTSLEFDTEEAAKMAILLDSHG
jgi:hypothetical protein